MTALKGKAIEAFVEKRDRGVAAILVYGPDEGLVRERGEKICRQVVADLNDPFNALSLGDADLKTEPGRLADEIAAMSFMGGERIIRVRTAGDGAAAAAAILIDGLEAGHVKPAGVVVIEAGDLGKTSKLRKLFEGATNAVALPCYADGPGDVRALAISAASAEGLRFSNDALDLLTTLLGEDRALSRAEIDKLILYAGPKGVDRDTDEISLDDVRAVLVDTVGDALDAVAGAAADGASMALSVALHRSATAGASSIGALRALQRQFARLNEAAGHISAGASPADAMKRLRPPVFFMETRAFEARLRRWPRAKTEAALDMLLDAELAAKSTGAPQDEIVERAALRLAAMAGR